MPARGQEPACLRCGACCRQPGYVRVTSAEIDAAAALLRCSAAEFIAAYTCLHPDRLGLSLTEKPNGACILLDEAANTCPIQAAKPRQCVDFPWGWRFRDAERICAMLRATAKF